MYKQTRPKLIKSANNDIIVCPFTLTFALLRELKFLSMTLQIIELFSHANMLVFFNPRPYKLGKHRRVRNNPTRYQYH